jgi:8-oxo-dGTP pyrophosphatase MutT (NUDIX family)
MKYIKEYNEYTNINAGILPFCNETKRFLIGFRSRLVSVPFKWGLFGGNIENDSIKEGALREFKEETKFKGNIELIDGYIFKESRFIYYNHIGLIDFEFKPKLNWEHTEFKWLTYEELLSQKNKHFGLEEFLVNSEEIFKKLIN